MAYSQICNRSPRTNSPHHMCSVVSPHLLQRIVDSEHASPQVRDSAARTLAHTHVLRTSRNAAAIAGSHYASQQRHSIVPLHMLQNIIDSEQSTPEAKDRARSTLMYTERLRTARIEGGRLYRVIYDAERSDELPGLRILKEGEAPIQDESADDVYKYFENTFKLYYEVFKRNSLDNHGLSLKGSIHYDKGYNNAYWNGMQMVFGDGDGEVFTSFTKDLDVIAHELTHGVTQFTSNLPYASQPGALNESMSDVFGIMAKQYALKQTSEDADWLIGAGMFLSDIKAKALRSMKAPGTAFNDPRLGGADDQPDHMDRYVNLPVDDDPKHDSGGVHINSGIPNKAFFLAAVGFGGFSWEKAGWIWYKTQLDPRLKTYAADENNWNTCFAYFAGLTVAHAAEVDKTIVRRAWQDVGVQPALV